MVGDSTAHALLEFAAIASTNQSTQVVHIHSLASDGRSIGTDIIVGAGVMLLARTVKSDYADPPGDGDVEMMRTRARLLVADTGRTAVASEHPDGDLLGSDWSFGD
ncbi:MAG: hypothetical protein JWO10_1480 [Microbacteriaceae bacterium]|nr:hypothetical protein [Microbacteriaceae bacterium]